MSRNHLLLGLRSIAKRDSSSFRRYLFSKLIEQNILVRVAEYLFKLRHFGSFICISLLLYSLRWVLFVRLNLSLEDKRLAIYHYSNEKKAISRIKASTLSGMNIIYYSNWPKLTFFSMMTLFRFLSQGKIQQWFRVSMFLLKKNGFLIGARQVEFLFLYGFYTQGFFNKNQIFEEVFSSSESNPEVISCVLAAKKQGSKLIYVNHSALDRELGIFFHDEIILPGLFYVDRIKPHLADCCDPVYKMMPHTLYRKKIAIPSFQEVRRVGIVCSIVVHRERLSRIIKDCLKCFASAEFVVRLHPNCTFSPVAVFSDLPKDVRIQISSNKHQVSLAKEAENWDFAILGNSSAHLDLLAMGIPTVFMDIDGINGDLYDFVGSGLVAEAGEVSEISSKIPSIYLNEDWVNIFNHYNAEPAR